MASISWIVLVVAVFCLADLNSATNHVPAQEWAEYKAKFNLDFTNSQTPEAYAQYFYAYNKKLIERHNLRFARGLTTFKLAVNQFTAMRLIHFNARFPVVTSTGPSFDSPPPTVQKAAPSYNPFTDLGLTSNIEDQGTTCNSGWAFSAAKSIEMLQALQTGNINPAPLSAQNLIDCAGRGLGCTKQEPQAAFDFLTQYNMDLHLESDYPNNNTLKDQGMCTPTGDLVVNLGLYARLRDGDDESWKALVSNGYPCVVEIDPTSFEYMHYSEGVFQQPRTRSGSHYILLVGYGMEGTTEFWLLQNSFGSAWGEMGLMRLEKSAGKNVLKNAICPTELA